MTITPDPEQHPQHQHPQLPEPQAPQQPVQHTQPTVPLPDTPQQQFSSSNDQRWQQNPQQAQQVPQPALTGPSHQSQQHQPQQPPQPYVAEPFAAPSFHTPSQAESSHEAATSEPTPSAQKSRAGVLFAGIAIGALVGGIVGGGASALVAANMQPNQVVQSQATGKVTLNNLETATSVSGVAVAATPSVVTLEVNGSNAAGSGSGVIINEDGYIVTNAHVATLDGEAGSDTEIRVWLSDGRILDGELIGTDPFADLAVVKVDADGLIPIAIADADSINVGDLAVAIGAPLNLSNTVTSGVVSALNRGIAVGSPIVPDEQDDQLDEPDDSGDFPWYRFGDPNEGQSQPQEQSAANVTRVTLPVVQTDASINPGNSGGALLNANAELIGINVAIASNSTDSSTAGSDGLGFAIPINLVTRVVDSLIAGERPSHGLLGIGVNDSVADTDEDRNFAGGLISEITPGGPAAEAGLQLGDVITAVNGIPADSGTSVSALIRMHEGGEEVVISYTRGGEPGETTVTLGTLEW